MSPKNERATALRFIRKMRDNYRKAGGESPSGFLRYEMMIRGDLLASLARYLARGAHWERPSWV